MWIFMFKTVSVFVQRLFIVLLHIVISLYHQITMRINSLMPRQKAFLWMKTLAFQIKYVPYGIIDNMPAWIQIISWRRTGDKPLSEAMMEAFSDAYMCHSTSMS